MAQVSDSCELLNLKQLSAMLKVPRTRISRWAKQGKFPKPKIDERQPFWSLAQVKHWLESQ